VHRRPAGRTGAAVQDTTHRWAILGAGGISRQFATDLAQVDGGTLVAIGSNSAEHAATFAEEVGAERGHGSYADAAADDVTVAYVGNNHNDHLAAATAAIDAGRHLLVEKPLSVSRSEAATLFDRAREAGVFSMEAMWTRFLPHIEAARRALADGAIGTVRRGALSLGRDQFLDGQFVEKLSQSRDADIVLFLKELEF